MDEPTSRLDKHSKETILKYIVGNNDLKVIAIVHNLSLLVIFYHTLSIDKNGIKEVSDISMLNIESLTLKFSTIVHVPELLIGCNH